MSKEDLLYMILTYLYISKAMRNKLLIVIAQLLKSQVFMIKMYIERYEG